MFKCTSVLLAILMLGTLSCSDDSSTNPNTEPVLKIAVKDALGDPVPDLRVSIWPHLDAPWMTAQPKLLMGATQPMFATSIRYDLPVACSVSIRVYDYTGRVATEPLVDEIGIAGTHEVTWFEGAGSEVRPDGVYRCIMRTFDAGGHRLFSDTILAVLWQPDLEMSIFGYTGTEGIYQTNDLLRFPSLLNLPDLQGVDETGTERGIFTYTDTVTIILADTVALVGQEFIRTIHSGSNLLNLIWDPTKSISRRITVSPTDSIIDVVDSLSGVPPTEFKLYQNYPNPFN